METAPGIRVSASIRLAYVMLRLAADIETQIGKYVLDILKRQYPEAAAAGEIDLTGTQIGNLMVNAAKKELQNDYAESLDAVQDFLAKIMARKDRPEFDFRAPTKKGNPGAKTWRSALNNMISNVRTTAMSKSMKRWQSKMDPKDEYAELLFKKQNQHLIDEGKAKKKIVTDEGDVREKTFVKAWTPDDDRRMKALEKVLKEEGVDPASIAPSAKKKYKGQRNKSIDEAFGTRGEEGGEPTGGEARIPDTEGLGKALDDRAAVKEFMDLLEEEVPNLRKTLSPEELALFDLIFYEDVGGFGSDIKENMGQASELKEKLMSSPEGQAIVQKNDKRWSGFVGDTRKKLLSKIQDFVENVLSPAQQQVLYDTFFSDTTEGELEAAEQKKEQEKADYQRGIDERKIARWKWEIQNTGPLDPKEQKAYTALMRKLQDQGVDANAIEPSENPEGSAKTTKEKRQKLKGAPAGVQQASVLQIASRVASLRYAAWQ